MKKFLKRGFAFLMALFLFLPQIPAPVSALEMCEPKIEQPESKEGEIIVVLNEDAGGTYLKADQAAANYGEGIQLKSSFDFSNESSLRVAVLQSSKLSTAKMLKKLKSNPAVKYAFPNYRKHITAVTNDTYADYQWALDNQGDTSGTPDADVNPEKLWEKAAQNTDEPIVAVCDTGIDLDSKEFEGVLWENPYGSKLLGRHGYDFSETWKDGRPQDDNGHGTHCAGIIAAKGDNDLGISGLNKGGVRIMALKWLDSEGSGYTDGVLGAYDYINRALDLGANIVAVSNSWGGLGGVEEMQLYNEIFNQFGQKGAVSVIAAGNEGRDITEPVKDGGFFFFDDEEYYELPACCNSPYAMTVAATNEKDELAAFSNYSATLTDIAAPGSDILSTVSYDCFNPTIYSAEKRQELVALMQDYEAPVTEGFGLPEVFTVPTTELPFSTNLEFAQTETHFGKGNGGMTVTTLDPVKQDDIMYYAIEMPFTIEDASKPYSISLMVKGEGPADVFVFDVAKDTENIKLLDLPVQAHTGCMEGGNFWAHLAFESTPGGEAQRRLVIIAGVAAEGTKLTFDDIAVSKCGADPKAFERYDFYCGTSMATPYVAGAVALMKKAYPNADALELINRVKNTGRKSAALEGKTENARILSLDNPDQYPPMLVSAGYDSKGNVILEGSFKNTTEVKANGTTVTPVKTTKKKITLADDGWNMKKTTFTVTNAYGSAELTTLLSNKKRIPAAEDFYEIPFISEEGTMLPAGDVSYFVSRSGQICELKKEDGFYNYTEYCMVDLYYLFGKEEDFSDVRPQVVSAAYSRGNIYLACVYPQMATNGTIYGYDTVLGRFNLKTWMQEALCELPAEGIGGASLAAYNGSIYLIGGYADGKLSDAVYKYNADKQQLSKISAKLPEGRAFTRFLQYEDKLVGAYGAVQSGKMPSVVVFDGKQFTNSKVSFSSDDFQEKTLYDSTVLHCYDGNLGLAKDGIFLNGAYVYKRGDTMTYKVAEDKVSNSAYAARNALSEPVLIGTTMPGCFIGFNAASDEGGEDWESVGSQNGNVDPAFENAVYKLSIKTGYAKVSTKDLTHVTLTSKLKKNYTYGEKVTVKFKAEKGYEITSILLNGKSIAKNAAQASFVIKTMDNQITVKTKKVAPNKVTGLKVKVTGKTAKLTWSKPARAAGYQIQQQVSGKWKTVKTIKSAATKTWTVKNLPTGTTKFRVRAFRTYKGEKLYGAWSAVGKAVVK